MSRALEIMVRELIAISKGLSRGMLEFVVPPPKTQKPKWCCCPKCKKWHTLGE
jgi:hypothetical protein